MRTPQFSDWDLNKLRQQLIVWRRTRAGGGGIPAEVWTAATALARVHGAGRVGRMLHLDFYKLRERLQRPRVQSVGPTFVEVGWPTAAAVAGSARSPPPESAVPIHQAYAPVLAWRQIGETR